MAEVISRIFALFYPTNLNGNEASIFCLAYNQMADFFEGVLPQEDADFFRVEARFSRPYGGSCGSSRILDIKFPFDRFPQVSARLSSTFVRSEQADRHCGRINERKNHAT